MKVLNTYKKINLNSEVEVFEYIMTSLKESIFTWDYFTDFEKVITKSNHIREELEILNSLVYSKYDIDEKFLELVRNNPSIRMILPNLVALRHSQNTKLPIIEDKISFETKDNSKIFNPLIPIDDDLEQSILRFFNETGIKDLLLDGVISNFIDYYIGVEVGMDTNARKNRTGTLVEELLEDYLSILCTENDYEYISQATYTRIHNKWGLDLIPDKISRRFDFAVLSSDKKLYLIEVNFYNGGGSKLKATAGEYKYLNEWLTSQGIEFIWVTDGKGWRTARTALNETFIENDYVLNFELISEGALEEIISGGDAYDK